MFYWLQFYTLLTLLSFLLSTGCVDERTQYFHERPVDHLGSPYLIPKGDEKSRLIDDRASRLKIQYGLGQVSANGIEGINFNTHCLDSGGLSQPVFVGSTPIDDEELIAFEYEEGLSIFCDLDRTQIKRMLFTSPYKGVMNLSDDSSSIELNKIIPNLEDTETSSDRFLKVLLSSLFDTDSLIHDCIEINQTWCRTFYVYHNGERSTVFEIPFMRLYVNNEFKVVEIMLKSPRSYFYIDTFPNIKIKSYDITQRKISLQKDHHDISIQLPKGNIESSVEEAIEIRKFSLQGLQELDRELTQNDQILRQEITSQNTNRTHNFLLGLTSLFQLQLDPNISEEMMSFTNYKVRDSSVVFDRNDKIFLTLSVPKTDNADNQMSSSPDQDHTPQENSGILEAVSFENDFLGAIVIDGETEVKKKIVFNNKNGEIKDLSDYNWELKCAAFFREEISFELPFSEEECDLILTVSERFNKQLLNSLNLNPTESIESLHQRFEPPPPEEEDPHRREYYDIQSVQDVEDLIKLVNKVFSVKNLIGNSDISYVYLHLTRILRSLPSMENSLSEIITYIQEKRGEVIAKLKEIEQLLTEQSLNTEPITEIRKDFESISERFIAQMENPQDSSETGFNREELLNEGIEIVEEIQTEINDENLQEQFLNNNEIILENKLSDLMNMLEELNPTKQVKEAITNIEEIEGQIEQFQSSVTIAERTLSNVKIVLVYLKDKINTIQIDRFLQKAIESSKIMSSKIMDVKKMFEIPEIRLIAQTRGSSGKYFENYEPIKEYYSNNAHELQKRFLISLSNTLELKRESMGFRNVVKQFRGFNSDSQNQSMNTFSFSIIFFDPLEDAQTEPSTIPPVHKIYVKFSNNLLNGKRKLKTLMEFSYGDSLDLALLQDQRLDLVTLNNEIEQPTKKQFHQFQLGDELKISKLYIDSTHTLDPVVNVQNLNLTENPAVPMSMSIMKNLVTYDINNADQSYPRDSHFAVGLKLGKISPIIFYVNIINIIDDFNNQSNPSNSIASAKIVGIQTNLFSNNNSDNNNSDEELESSLESSFENSKYNFMIHDGVKYTTMEIQKNSNFINKIKSIPVTHPNSRISHE